MRLLSLISTLLFISLLGLLAFQNCFGIVPGMRDKYAIMDSSAETYIAKNFQLESGHVLPEAHVSMTS